METALVVKMSAYYFAAFCLILLAVSNGKVIDDPIQDDDNTYLGERHRRDAALLNGLSKCNNYSNWINRNQPENRTNEEEKLSQTELDKFCPSHGNVTALKCMDIKGEPFENKMNETNSDGNYVFSCMKPIDGASCYLINANASCPDYLISFYCTCPSTTYRPVTSVGSDRKTTGKLNTTMVTNTTTSSSESSTTSTKPITTSTTPSPASADKATDSTIKPFPLQHPTTNATEQTSSSRGTDSGANNSTGDDGKSNALSGGSNNNNNKNTIGNSNVPWWLIPVLVAVVLFIINVIIAICLHKKVHKRIDQTVHPL